MKRKELTKYHPVGLPVSPSLVWEVRTTRTLGEDIVMLVMLLSLVFLSLFGIVIDLVDSVFEVQFSESM